MSDASKPYGNVVYADPGYQADKKARYPVDTKSHAKSAWSYINQAKNAKLYTAAQLKRIKARIVKALKKFGVTVANEGWVLEPAMQISESAIAEHYGMDDGNCGSWYINASNGPINISLSCYGMDPADMDVILRAAADAACKALAALDPDMDGDIDVPGAGAEDTDGDADESAADPDPADDPDLGESAEETPAPEAAAGDTTERTESAMPESTPAAETTAAASTFSQADVDAAVARGIAAYDEQRRARKAAKRTQEAAAAAPVTESAPAAPAAPAQAAPAAPAAAAAAPAEAQESEDDRIKRIVDERLAAEFPEESEDERIARKVQEAYDAEIARRVQTGQTTVSRKGVVKGATETAGAATTESLNEHGLPASWPNKPLHQFTQDELNEHTGPVLVRHVLGDRADLLA